MKIAITGGHLAPALAVIEKLPKDTEILYIGRKHALEGDKALSLEYQKITSLKIPFANLSTGRLQRKFTKHTLKSLFKIPGGIFRAYKILREFKPDAVVCFGGYLQIPVGLSAYILQIPVILHEQALQAGLANKFLAPFAKIICISWDRSAKYFPKHKTVLTGIPIRKEFVEAKKIPHAHLKKGVHKTIYITGGSQGAHAINALIESILEKLLKKYYIIHQTGGSLEFKDYERLNRTRDTLTPDLKLNYELHKFIDPEKIAIIMNSADLVISRAGINTIAELIYLGKSCILIPLPYGQTNEQLENALYIQELGLGLMLEQKSLTPEKLYSQIVEFTAKLDKEPDSAFDHQKLINYEAAEKIVKAITESIKKDQQQKDKK